MITIAEIFDFAQKKNILIFVRDEKIILKNRKGVVTEELKRSIIAQKDSLIKILSSENLTHNLLHTKLKHFSEKNCHLCNFNPIDQYFEVVEPSVFLYPKGDNWEYALVRKTHEYLFYVRVGSLPFLIIKNVIGDETFLIKDGIYQISSTQAKRLINGVLFYRDEAKPKEKEIYGSCLPYIWVER